MILKSKRKIFNVLNNIKCLRDPHLLGVVLGLDYKVLYGINISKHDLEILRLLLSECYLLLNKELLIKVLNKKPMILKFGNNLFRVECAEDLYHSSMCYEAETLSFIEHNVKCGGIFVDVGANIGGFTVRLSAKSKVYAFEPDPRNYYILCSNLRLNNLKAITCNNATYDTENKVKLYISEYHGRHSVAKPRSRYIWVKAVKLDDVLISEDSLDVLKIDVEGAELNVLRGAASTLLKTRFVVIECTILGMNKLVKEFLADYGFKYTKRLENNCLYSRI